MNYCLISVILATCLQITTRAEVVQGRCSCAVFDVSGNEPLIEHALPFDVSCDAEGDETCLQLCIALAQSAKEEAPAMICAKLNKHVENLKVAVHTKSCNADAWRFTGLQSSETICCHEGKETACNSTTITSY